MKNKTKIYMVSAFILVAFALILMCGCMNRTTDIDTAHGFTDELDFAISSLKCGDYNVNEGEPLTGDNKTDENEEVHVIVSLGEGIADYYLNSDTGDTLQSYLCSEKASMLGDRFLSEQNDVIEYACAIGVSLDVEYNYSTLLNGFGASIRYGDVSKLMAIEGVCDVVLANRYEIPDSHATESGVGAGMFGGTGIQVNDTQYSGAGLVIAVLDTGLDYKHSAF